MNILILTPIHPSQIVEMNALYKKYSKNNNIYSIQAMALLNEETFKTSYIVSNYIFTNEILNRPKLVNPKNKKYDNTIIYGNIDKRTNIKFDHIIAFTSHIAENDLSSFDPYLNEANKIYEDFSNKNEKAQTPQYYTLEDAQHIFPTFHHLCTFLKACGIKENDNNEL